MTDRSCRNCRFYLPDGPAGGDCINVQTGLFVTKADSTCPHFHADKAPAAVRTMTESAPISAEATAR